MNLKRRENNNRLSKEWVKIKNIMKLKNELEKLNELKTVDTDKFESQYLSIKEKFISPDEVRFIDNYIGNMLLESEERIDSFIDESVKTQLEKVSEIISLSYVATRY